ncbi:MAG TPA: hypothetical protein VFC23_02410 [Thermoanaerobaculia bacterium]|nr:hypothetical protein [Thermoanaerobaculia bacterium]
MSDGPKYRQRGYQDSERRDEKPRPGLQGPREKKDGPRGRGLGAPSEAVFRCNACGEKRLILLGDVLPPDATCAKSGADLHTCSNCIHFDTAVRWECRKNAELPARVAKKRDRNDCALFTPKLVQEFAKDSDKPSPGDARSAFDALFKF